MSKSGRRILTTAVAVLVVLIVTVVMVARTSDSTRDNSISHMKSIAQEQTFMIRSYVDNAKQTLNSFATASEVQQLLTDVDSQHLFDPTKSYSKDEVLSVLNQTKDSAAAAQSYTERFSSTVADPEGIWIGDWYTHCLTHTNSGTVGITTRDVNERAAALKELQDGMMNSPDYLFNTGIIISPATQRQILSMYKAVMKDGKPVGFVGFGIFTENLVSALNSLELNTAGTTFAMVNVKDNKYIFCPDESMVAQEVTDPKIIEACEKFSGSTEDATDYAEYSGNISFYSYMGEEGWLLIISSPSSEVFSFSRSINTNLILFCVVCIVLIIIFNVISIRQEEALQKLEQSRKKQQAISKNLHIAALKDILTDVSNRIKFIDDYGRDDNGQNKAPDNPASPYCFAMITIAKFSQINIQYGNDAGDAVLATTADILKQHFDDENIYRTGSDEFVVAVKSDTGNTTAVIMEISKALAELQAPRQIGNETLNISYCAAIVKRGTNITPAVLTNLKDIINTRGITVDNNPPYVDLDVY